ncbi:MAG: hypothetical protein RhofKO_38180 [Rhodothermales bacterium]
MPRHFLNSLATVLGPLIGLGLLLSGCASTGSTSSDALPPLRESVVFQTSQERMQVVDAATAILVANNFPITLANERLGLIQTGYMPLTTLLGTYADADDNAALDQLMMKVTLNTEARGDGQLVQLVGTFQRTGSSPTADNLIGLYWLERLGESIAAETQAPFVASVSDEIYTDALAGNIEQMRQEEEAKFNPRRALIAAGLIIGVVFAVSLIGTATAPE